MPHLGKIVVMSRVVKELGNDSTVKERLETIIRFLDLDEYNKTLETIVLNEVSRTVESFAELGIRSIAPLIIQSGMYKTPDVIWDGSRRNLIGAAAVVDFALRFAGLETKIMFNKQLEKYVLVAIL